MSRISILVVCILILFTSCIKEVPESIPPPPKMIINKGYPKVVQAWNPAENMLHLEESQQLAIHDLVFDGPYVMKVEWLISEEQPYEMLSTQLVTEEGESDLTEAIAYKEEIVAMNPDFLVLCEIPIRECDYVNPEDITPFTKYWDKGGLPPSSNFWLRDSKEALIPSWGEDDNEDGVITAKEASACLVDFTDEAFQQIIVDKAIALSESGVFDGMFMDWWSEKEHTLVDISFEHTYMELYREVEARIELLEKIRANVPEDFLILVNSNYDKIEESAPYVNGIFMECYRDIDSEGYSDGALRQIEDTLSWAETHLRKPTINCVEGWRDVDIYSPNLTERELERTNEINQQWMRLFTTLVLTHSDGYVLFSDNNAQPLEDHLHHYYDFWNQDLGMPLTEQAIAVEGEAHIYVREFENKTVIYNGSSRDYYYNDEMIKAYDGAIIDY